MRQYKILFWLFVVVSFIGIFWDSAPIIKNSVHAGLDPILVPLLNWSPFYGMIILVVMLNLALVLLQKYTTDQKTMKGLKKEQKELQEEMKKYRDNPEKMMEFNKKQFGFVKENFKHGLRPLMFTMIPFVLLFRWFMDYFTNNPYSFFGFMSWFWFYMLLSIIASSILRKVFDVA